MLQQTQVATVEGYFKRFIDAFPDVQRLAAADEQQVLRLWEGLGYYRRARQMHQAAQQIMADHGGQLPQTAGAWRRLPGVGRYTAGAITSIAFDAREPILEANTIRLLARLLVLRERPTQAVAQRKLWAVAAELLPRSNVGQFNQALMELGSQICTPRNPRCDACPVAPLCETRERGWQAKIPVATERPKTTHVCEAAVVVYRRGEVLLVRRGEDERWAGLWDFPRFAIDDPDHQQLEEHLVAGVRQATGMLVEPLERLTTIKHPVTRYLITLECHAAKYVRRAQAKRSLPEMQWLVPQNLENVPLSATGRKLSRIVAKR